MEQQQQQQQQAQRLYGFNQHSLMEMAFWPNLIA